MTHSERNQLILKAMEEYTVQATASKKIARETLIKEGIYTKAGELRPEFGGVSKKARVSA